MKADVFFGSGENEQLPNWRKAHDPDEDDDDDEPQPGLAAILGFDPKELDDEA